VKDMLSAALEYVECGYSVFPVTVLDKRPLTERGFYDASLDEDQIAAWWEKWPQANIGMPTEKLVVIDVDPGGEKWYQARQALFNFSGGVVAKTPRGGWHIIYRMPEGKDVRCSSGKVDENVDIRANGGYIVVSPSSVRQKDGSIAVYRWIDDLPDREKLTPIPEELLETIEKAHSRKIPIQNADGKITEGGRHDYLFRAGRELYEIGMSGDLVYQTLHSLNLERCEPPLTNGSRGEGIDSELRRIVRDVQRDDRKRLLPGEEPWVDEFFQNVLSGSASYSHFLEATGQAIGEAEDDQEGEVEPIPQQLFDSLPALCQDAYQYYVDSSAWLIQPELWLGSWISYTGAMMSHQSESPSGTRSNIFCLGLAGTGKGKDATRTWFNRVDTIAPGMQMLDNGRYFSDSGLVTTLRENQTTCLVMDEFGLQLSDAYRLPPLVNVLRMFNMMLEMYTASSATQWHPQRYADSKRRSDPLSHPCLSMWNVSTPQTFWEDLTLKNVFSGLLPRFLLFLGDDKPAKSRPDIRTPIPESVERFRNRWMVPTMKDSMSKATDADNVVMEVDPEADSYCQEQVDRLESEIDDTRQESLIWSRFSQSASKLAMIHAGWIHGDSGGSPSIDVESAVWGCDLAEFLIRRFQTMVNAKISIGSNDYQGWERKIYSIIKKRANPLGWCRKSDITKRVPGDIFSRVITVMERNEIVEKMVQPTTGRPVTMYRCVTEGMPRGNKG